MSRKAWRGGWACAAAILWVAALACADETGSATSPSPAVAGATESPKPDFDAGVILEEFPPGGPRNEVRLHNQENGRFKARASIRLHRIESDEVKPVNIAFAQSSCTDCQTIAVALQVAIYQRGAHVVQPENIAVAANVGCTRCVTIARAIQFAIPVDDPKEDVPDEVKRLIKDMDKELRYFASVDSLSEIDAKKAQSRLELVLSQYAELQRYLLDMSDSKETGESGDASPSPGGASPQSAPTSSPTPSFSPTPTATP
jgi:putative peptide zinc metalloprotease protein